MENGAIYNHTRAWYGGVAEDKNDRRYHKQYSTIIPAEIVHDKEQNSYKFVFFTGGDAYSAPIANIEKFTNGTSDGGAIYHLQRDYLGSILNITKQGSSSVDGGELVEHRQFGAWGTIDGFWSKDTGTTMGYDSILDRGYTGHEHFYDLGLIHMNGRIYDPQLGRFLSPDNYVQDPYNTQNFNRYGYVLNNPLIFVDPSGEFIFLSAIIVGAVVGAYIGGAQANDGNLNPTEWNWSSGSTWLGVGGGALIGGVSGGVGAIASAGVASVLTVGGAIGGAIIGASGGLVAGGISGGFMSLLPGGSGDFWQDALNGALIGAATGGVIGGIHGGFSTPKGHSFLTGNELRSPVNTVSSLQAQGINGLDDTLSLSGNGIPTGSGNASPVVPRPAPSIVRGVDGMHSGNLNIQALDEVVIHGSAAAKTGTSLVKAGTQFSMHSLERLAQRGITQKMALTAINKGQKFYDPLNKSINYVLPNGFGSGKSLLIGTNPLTGKVTTAIRSSKNLIKNRFIPIK